MDMAGGGLVSVHAFAAGEKRTVTVTVTVTRPAQPNHTRTFGE